MRVWDRNLSGAAAAGASGVPETQRTGNGGAERKTASGGIADRVQLSSVAGRLSLALQSAGEGHAARVAALAVAYREGRYAPDAKATASGMLSEALAGTEK